jgi:hypothetical protein
LRQRRRFAGLQHPGLAHPLPQLCEQDISDSKRADLAASRRRVAADVGCHDSCAALGTKTVRPMMTHLHRRSSRWPVVTGCRRVAPKSGILLIAVRIRASRFSGCLAKKGRSSGYQRPTQPTTGKTPLPSRFCQNCGTSGSRNQWRAAVRPGKGSTPCQVSEALAARPPGSRAEPASTAPRHTVGAPDTGSRQHHR